MDSVEPEKAFRQIIQRVLSEYAQIRYANGDITNEAVFDQAQDRYVVISVDWQGDRRVQHCLLHVDIIDGKVWVQREGTDDGIAGELESAGIPRFDIVLAFHPERDRALLPEYAVR